MKYLKSFNESINLSKKDLELVEDLLQEYIDKWKLENCYNDRLELSDDKPSYYVDFDDLVMIKSLSLPIPQDRKYNEISIMVKIPGNSVHDMKSVKDDMERYKNRLQSAGYTTHLSSALVTPAQYFSFVISKK